LWRKSGANHPVDDEEQGYLVSVSDLMAGLLFLFTIALAVFALNFKFAETRQQEEEKKYVEEKAKHLRKKDQLEGILTKLLRTKERRDRMLDQIENEAGKYKLKITVDKKHGVLRLQEGILFDSGSAALKPDGQKNLKILAEIFQEVLPEYLCPQPSTQETGGAIDKVGTIETVFIEGHTDRQPVRPGGRFQDNFELSAARARTTFKFLAENAPELIELKNGDGQYIFSLSGYGEHRPVKAYEGVDDVPENRRIDFRFIMFPPHEPQTEQELKERLKNSGELSR